jgi:hypothetical protein
MIEMTTTRPTARRSLAAWPEVTRYAHRDADPRGPRRNVRPGSFRVLHGLLHSPNGHTQVFRRPAPVAIERPHRIEHLPLPRRQKHLVGDEPNTSLTRPSDPQRAHVWLVVIVGGDGLWMGHGAGRTPHHGPVQ